MLLIVSLTITAVALLFAVLYFYQVNKVSRLKREIEVNEVIILNQTKESSMLNAEIKRLTKNNQEMLVERQKTGVYRNEKGQLRKIEC